MKSIIPLFVALVFVTGVGCSNAQEPFRYWTTNDGVKSSVRLKLVEQTDTEVTLERETDGKTVTLPLSRLGAVDKRYLASRKTTAEPTPSESTSASAASNDWPQWRGPDRTGISSHTGLLKEWPADGLEPTWSVTGVGEGFSTPSVADGTLYVIGAQGGEEKLFALNIADGSEKWQATIGAKADGGYPGSRSTPTVDGDMVYGVSSDGDLACVKRSDGAIVWRKNFKRDFGGKPGGWNYAESPLIDGEKIICTPGGDSATMVALNKADGGVIWKGSARGVNTTAAFSSPIKATIAGVPQYVNFVHGAVVSFAAADGTALWHYDNPANGTANCSTPVVEGDFVFAASGYSTGGGKARISRSGGSWSVDEQYFIRKFENHHGGFVLVDGYLYGANNTVLLCVDWKTGDIKWQDRCVGKGSISYADGMLYVRGEGGEIALVEANPSEYRLQGKFSQPERSGQPAWPHPVIANDSLFIRDQGRMLCFPLK